MEFLNSSAVIDGCLIQGNQAEDAGGGINISGSTVTVSASIITANEATEAAGGVRVIGFGDSLGVLRMVNCFVVTNSASRERGGGIEFGYNYTGELMNVTVADNQSPVGGGVAKNFDPGDAVSVKMTNTIVFFNEGGDLLGSYLIAFSDIGVEVSGESNISADPLFVDRAGGDYHLSKDSPCIDAGTNDGVPNTDLDGDPRPDGCFVDIGADEWYQDRSCHRIYLPLAQR